MKVFTELLKYFSISIFSFFILIYSSIIQADEINKLTVSDVIVEEAEIIGQKVMVPGWMTYYSDFSMLYEYAGTMTALSVNTGNLNKKQRKWVVSKCGSGCYVNVTGVIKKDQNIMATEIEKMGFKDKMINIAIGEKNLLLN